MSLLLGCAHADGTERLNRYRAMSDESKAAFDKYHQFFTEEQEWHYLRAPTDEERSQLIAELHIEERLAKYPQYVQDAVWSQQAVPGMDKSALFLSWGRPDRIDTSEATAEDSLEQEVWIYDRGGERRVILVNDVVTSVEKR